MSDHRRVRLPEVTFSRSGSMRVSVGLPGIEKSNVTPLVQAQRPESLEMNLGPLSGRMVFSTPWTVANLAVCTKPGGGS